MTESGLREAVARADAGDWSAAREGYVAVLGVRESAEARHGLARACWWLGEVRTALDHGERAVAAYEEEGRFADAAMLAVHVSLWYLSNFDNDAAADGWLARARTLARRGDSDVVAGWVTLVSGYVASDPVEGRRLIESAADTAARLSDRDLATMARADLGLWHVASGEVDSGLALLDEALAEAFGEPRGMLEVAVWSGCNMLAACSLVDDLRRATQWCRAADRFTETYGCPFLQARCRAHYGSVLVATGRWEEAEQELAAALAMSADTGRGPRLEAITALAELRRCQGEPEAALVLLDDADHTPYGLVTQARCLLDLGRPEEARSVLSGELAARADGLADPLLVAVLAEAELAAGRTEEAARLVAPEASAWELATFPRTVGLLARAAGLVATAAGDTETARRQLGLALDTFARLELPYDAARVELDLARLLVSVDPGAAAARARSAHRRHESLGARREAAGAAALLRSLGVVPPPGARGGAPLSERERDVLGLVAQGLTNPEIGARLFLSPRTVGHHVSSILHKLGLRSRAEAAAYAARESARRTP
ncbi:helix-turn-helix transcriptional regulator [Nocardioides sp. GXQ0305]|uniref:helix-turn-helix transcriptional regulator n=1 Tax=Nocardioides sp. GXQ0305 TaxID=3423912 RepID=UPI003D7DD4B8